MMTKPVISEGMAIKYPGTGPDHDVRRPHTCIVVKDDQINGDVYLVPVCSASGQVDSACILDKNTPVLGLTHESYIGYFAAKKVPRKSLAAKLDKLEITCLGHIPDYVLSRVKDGVSKSLDTEPWFKTAIKPAPKKNVLTG